MVSETIFQEQNLCLHFDMFSLNPIVNFIQRFGYHCYLNVIFFGHLHQYNLVIESPWDATFSNNVGYEA